MLQYFLFHRSSFTFWDVVFLVLTYALLILVVLPFHEFAHAYVAYRCGDSTAKWQGRLTLNPFAHLTLYGTLMLVLCGFGTARPVPVNPMNFRNRKRDSVLVALAGPLSNLLMAILAVVIFSLVALIGNETALQIAEMACLHTLLPINITLAVFNLLPIPPLDGSRVWSTFLPLRWRVTLEQHSNLCIILLFVLLMTGVLDGPLDALTRLVGNGIFRLFDLPYYFA